MNGLARVLGIGMFVVGMNAGVAGGQATPQPLMVINDAPFERVWQAALGALSSLAIAREEKDRGVIVVESEWAAHGLDRLAYDRVRETVTVRLERFDPLTTKVSAAVELRKKKKDGEWVLGSPSPDAQEAVLTAINDRLRGRR